MKTLLREKQLKFTDVEEMRVDTNDRHIAEQIKTDKMESVVMNGSKVGKFGKIDGKQNLKNVVMNGVKSGKVGKLDNCKSDEGMLSQSEERLCRSIIKGLKRRNHERHTMLADVEEEQEQNVICFDDITGKELPWHAVRKARELKLKYLRDLGVFEKVDEKEAVAKYGVTPVDTKWVDTDKSVRGGAHADQITDVCERVQN